ncbi:hypothetical protein Dimus_013632 [Dionaea muscipula]
MVAGLGGPVAAVSADLVVSDQCWGVRWWPVAAGFRLGGRRQCYGRRFLVVMIQWELGSVGYRDCVGIFVDVVV